MAAMVLNSPRATEVSVYVVRAFVELRDTLVAHKELTKRLDELESRLERKLANPRPGRCSDRPRLQRSPAFGYHRRKFIRQMLL